MMLELIYIDLTLVVDNQQRVQTLTENSYERYIIESTSHELLVPLLFAPVSGYLELVS